MTANKPEPPASWIATGVVVAATWAPSVAALIANRANPSIETALGVAYAGAFGLGLGCLLAIVGMVLGARRPSWRPHIIVVAASLVLAFGFFAFANQGALSVV